MSSLLPPSRKAPAHKQGFCSIPTEPNYSKCSTWRGPESIPASIVSAILWTHPSVSLVSESLSGCGDKFKESVKGQTLLVLLCNHIFQDKNQNLWSNKEFSCRVQNQGHGNYSLDAEMLELLEYC